MNYKNILNIRNKDKITVFIDNDEIIFYDNLIKEKIYSDNPQSLLCDLLKSYKFEVKMV